MSMTREEAARILDPETSREALDEIEYYGGFRGYEAVLEAVNEACRIAAEVLRNRKTGEALTLEQLREMNGQPVWVKRNEEPYDGKWFIVDHADVENPDKTLYTKEGVTYSDYGKYFTAYAYPPAHIDREAEEIKKAMIDINNLAVSYIENGPYENDLPGMEFAVKVDRISKAWAELEKRMGVMGVETSHENGHK